MTYTLCLNIENVFKCFYHKLGIGFFLPNFVRSADITNNRSAGTNRKLAFLKKFGPIGWHEPGSGIGHSFGILFFGGSADLLEKWQAGNAL